MATITSGIHDNHNRGPVGDFLKEKIQKDAELSIVSAYFTIYAFEALKDQLLNINHLNFLFGEPGFIRSLDPDKTVNLLRELFDRVQPNIEMEKAAVAARREAQRRVLPAIIKLAYLRPKTRPVLLPIIKQAIGR